MTQLWSDGFDTYTTGSDLALRYTTYGGANFSGPSSTAFDLGQCASALTASKIWETAAHEVTVFFSIRLKFNSPLTPGSQSLARLTLVDGTDALVTIAWDAITGSILVYSGTIAGTLLATFTSMFLLNVWDSWQGKIVVNSATGSVDLRKNGSSSSVITPLTGVNTRGPVSVHNYSTGVLLDTSNSSWEVDDAWFNNDDGTDPTSWPPDVRCCMVQPEAGTADDDFLPSQDPFTYGPTTNTFTTTFLADRLVGITFTTTVAGEISDFDLNLNTGFTGHIKGAIYDTVGGSNGGPGTLLATSGAVTNPSSGLVNFSFSPINLAKNTTYFMAVLSDTSFTVKSASGGSVSEQTTTYSGGFPATGLTSNVSTGTPNCVIDVAPFKWSLINNLQETGDAFYIYSNTVNDEDLYDMTALPVTPTAILGVRPIVYWRKSDAGSRSGSLRLIANGSSDTDEVTVPLSSTFIYTSKFLALDPTSAAWDLTSINGLQLGVKVAA